MNDPNTVRRCSASSVGCESRFLPAYAGRLASGRLMPVLLSLCVAIPLAALAPAAAAEDDDTPAQDAVNTESSADTGVMELSPVVVTEAGATPYTVKDSATATRLPLTLRETPQSVTVVTRERLDDQNLVSLRSVLDNTPGVYSRAWDTERVVFTARGFDIDNLMYDGIPVEKNFSFNTGSIDDTIDTALYERIEIVRGATGLMTGAGNPAAAVNLVRKRADSRVFTGTVDLTYGSWDDRRVEADVSTPLTQGGGVRARAVGVYQDRESYQDVYSNEKQVFYGVVDADLTPDTLLSIGYDYQNNLPKGNTWGSFPLFLSDGTLADWPRSVTTAPDWSFWNRKRENAFAELRHDFGNDWTLRGALNWRRYEEDEKLFYLFGWPDPVTGQFPMSGGVPDPVTGIGPYAYRSDAKVIERALDIYGTGAFDLFGRRHQIVFGYTGSIATNNGKEYAVGELADPGNFFEWDGSYPEPEFASEGVLLQDIESHQNGVYGTARFQLADTLKLIAGARYATWKTDYYYLYDSPDAGFHHDYRETIPYAGLIWDFSRQFSAFASYTEIFQPQNARGAGGAYLDPVDGRSYEVGVKGEHFDHRLNTSLTLFRTLQDNVATPVFDDDGNPVWVAGQVGVLQASQGIDGTQTEGFELEASGELRRGWNLSLGWSHYQLEDGDGNAVRAFVPRTLVRLFSAWTPAVLDRLTLGGGVNWQSSSHTFVGSPDGGMELHQGSVLLLNAMARYEVTTNLSIQANGSNLLDKKYFVLDEYDNTYYGAPRSFSVGMKLDF
jgi:outer membrane receptor for ferric coprogen and ferric-rhodotorulic acid